MGEDMTYRNTRCLSLIVDIVGSKLDRAGVKR